MARFNVEDDWFEDSTKRRAALRRAVEKLPRDPEREADGYALDAWRLSQRYWKNNKGLVPYEIWVRAGLDPLIEADLAERRPEGVYVRGTEAQHAWLHQHSTAGRIGGKASAEARKRRYGTTKPVKRNRNSASESLHKTRSDASGALHESRSVHEASSSIYIAENPKLAAPKGGDVWSAYRAAYFARYGVEPVRNARVNTNCRQLVDRLGGDGAIAVVRFYLSHNNAFYVQKSHALGLCLSDAEALHTQMLNGQAVTGAAARSADERAANAQAFANVAARLAARRQEGGDGEQ